MKNNLRIIFILFIIAIVCAVLYFFKEPLFISTTSVSPTKTSVEVPREKQLIIATVGTKGDLEGGYQPFADYLVSQLKEYGITTAVITTSGSASEMANNLRLNKVDIYIDTVFSSYIVSKLSNSPIVAARWEYGEDKYNSVIFTKKDNQIEQLEDLYGKKIAFFEPYSTSAYFLPKSELLNKKIELEEIKNKKEPVSADKVGYYFEYNDFRIYNAVMSGTADAGALSEGVLKRFAGDKFDEIQLLHVSPDVYRSVIVLNSALPTEIKHEIEDIMFSMHTSVEGKKALDEFHRTSKFSKIEENDPLLMPIKILTGYVEKEIIQR